MKETEDASEKEPFAHATATRRVIEERKSEHHSDAMDFGWGDLDSLQDLEDPVEAFKLGKLIGAKQEAQFINQHLNHNATAIYFETYDELWEAVKWYDDNLFITSTEKQNDGTLKINIGYQWLDSISTDVEEFQKSLEVTEDEDEYLYTADLSTIEKGVELEAFTVRAYSLSKGHIFDLGPRDKIKTKIRKLRQES